MATDLRRGRELPREKFFKDYEIAEMSLKGKCYRIK
jgi:hypothetical protein